MGELNFSEEDVLVIWDLRAFHRDGTTSGCPEALILTRGARNGWGMTIFEVALNSGRLPSPLLEENEEQDCEQCPLFSLER